MADRRRIAAALEYLGAMRDRAAEFGSGVAGTLANRARDVGGMAYEALTSDPNIGRMNTAEFSDAAAARAPTPRLDATAQGFGALGKGLITQPIQTGKAVLVDPIVNAFESPLAMGQFAGEVINPLRLASALRRGPMLELEGYQGSPHKFEPTPDNPLGELDSSKIGTGEGAQAYGHGHYIAENRNIGETYRKALSEDVILIDGKKIAAKRGQGSVNDPESIAINEILAAHDGQHEDPFRTAIDRLGGQYGPRNENYAKAIEIAREWRRKGATVETGGHLYTLDLPDEMIDRMLDWDKPLSEQSPSILAALEKSKNKQIRAMLEYAKTPYASAGIEGETKTMGEAYRLLSMNLSNRANAESVKASKLLQEAGIPGIRYLDAGSRGKDGTGTRNFVVFPGEEKKVKILRRE